MWLGTLLAIRLVVELQAGAGAPEWILAVVPLLFIYVPVAWCRFKGLDSWSYHLSIPSFSDREAWRAVFDQCAATWSSDRALWLATTSTSRSCSAMVRDMDGPTTSSPWWPTNSFLSPSPKNSSTAGTSRPDSTRSSLDTKVFGVSMGMGSAWGALFFAFGHTVVLFQWWHFATFIPGLVFARLREKADSPVMAGLSFHAICNIAVILDTHYGLINA